MRNKTVPSSTQSTARRRSRAHLNPLNPSPRLAPPPRALEPLENRTFLSASIAGSVSVAVAQSDLLVTDINGPTSAAVGGSILVGWTVQNNSTVTTTSRWSDGIYLSTDTVLDAGDTRIKVVSARSRTPLAPGASYNATDNVLIPSNTPTGNYHLIVQTDDLGNLEAESDETNNWRAATSTLTLGAPDLAFSAITYPATAFPGSSLTFEYTVVNQSATYDAAGPWTDRAVLSTDDVFGNADDVFLGEWSNPSSLAPGASYTASQTVTVPDGAGGASFLLIKTDNNLMQGETDETNNVIARSIQTQPSISIGDTTVTEGNAGTTNATFAVTLDMASTQAINVGWATANGTATAGTDFTAASGTVNFAPGQTSQNVTVLVTGDKAVEPSETFTVNLSGATNAAIADAQGLGTINNDDAAPVAAADTYATDAGTMLNVGAPGVLANDTDANGDALTAGLVTNPSHGSVTLSANGSFVYAPTAGYTGPDSFTYRATDGANNSNTATVNITVNLNQPPTAANDTATTNEDTALNVGAPGVLGNDSDPEGAPLTAVLVAGPGHGALTLNPNGSFLYTPAANYNGTDSFTYRASDGSMQSGVATVSLTVNSVNDAPVATLGPTSPGIGGDVTPGGNYYWFKVTYTDDGSVDFRTIGNTDVIVTSPGYSQTGTLANLVALSGGGLAATYRIPAPGGTWNPPDNGNYTIALRATEVADNTGLFAPGATLGTLNVNVPDIANPTATLEATNITVPGGNYYWFKVTYADDTAIDYRTIGGTDVLVTGPNSYSQMGTLANLTVSSDGKWTATYRIAAPGGIWDAPDNGPYVVNMRPGEVSDTVGKSVPAGVLGGFGVQFADSTPPTATLSTTNVFAGFNYWFQVAYADNAGVNYASIDNNDVEVSGPNGYLQPGTLSNLSVSGGVWTATYRIPAPGGTWGPEDNGTYTFTMKANQVSDTSGNFVAAGTLGTYPLGLPPAAAPASLASASVAASSPFSDSAIIGARRATTARTSYADLLA